MTYVRGREPQLHKIDFYTMNISMHVYYSFWVCIMTAREIRRKILENLYKRFKEHPYYRLTPKELQETLHINLQELNYNVIYLEEKGYIELQKPLEGSIFVGARITTKGIDLIEDEYQFNAMFSVNQTSVGPESNIFQDFTALIHNTQSAPNIDINIKELIIEEIKEISNELQKNTPSYSKIKKYVNKIKDRDLDVYTKVMHIIKTPIIIAKNNTHNK